MISNPSGLHQRTVKWLSFQLILMVSGTGLSQGTSNSETYIRSLIRFNSHTPVEPSWPHTGHHWLVGSSIQGTTGKQKNETSDHSGTQAIIRQEWSVIKSLIYPLDTGISYSHFYGNQSQTRASQINAWAQWTLWERFGWPAIAGRVAYSKISAAWDSRIRSWTGGIQASWGFKRITIWSGLYQSRHKPSWTEKPPPQTLALKSDQAVANQLLITERFHTLGIHLQIFRDFLNIAIEKQVRDTEDFYSLKLSCLL